MERLSPNEAAARLNPADTLGLPLGTGVPIRFVEALGGRDDWQDLRIQGALMTALSEVFLHPNVHYLSGFFGPLEQALRDQGANVGFVPADFRRFDALLQQSPSRVLATAAAPPDGDGFCSLSLHAGAHVDALHRAGADPERVLLVETSPHFPRTRGYGEHTHRLHLDEIDWLVESDAMPFELAADQPNDVDRAIAAHVASLVPDGATLQTGIGAVPSVVAGLLADGEGGGYGIHSEMFTTGLMRLHKAGKVTNANKGVFPGVSVATFAAGTRELYDWLDGNDEVAFLPVGVVNNPDRIAANESMITINGALAVDIHGQIVADTRGGEQFSGIGGHEDFVQGPGLDVTDRSILCIPSTWTRDGALHSRFLPWFDAGTVITTPRHQVHTIVTEYGIAELAGRTVNQRGQALAAIAHPDFRDGLLEAAASASGGRAPHR
jgi:acyl-CoA hydrolase